MPVTAWRPEAAVLVAAWVPEDTVLVAADPPEETAGLDGTDPPDPDVEPEAEKVTSEAVTTWAAGGA